MLVLSRRQVEELLDLDALVEALAVAMSDLTAGRASVPARTFAVAGPAGLLAAMPAYLATGDVLAAKLVAVFPGNAGTRLETHQAVVTVFDPATGEPLAMMDGASITAWRTAAGSALATRLCAREEARVLAIIGTGVQARSHARAMRRVRGFAEVVVAGRTPRTAQAFAAEIGARAASSCADAVAAADVVCCCTHATAPVLRREWLRPAAHVNAVGFSAGPELDPAIFAGALVVVESRAAAIGDYPNGAVDITTAVNQGLLTVADIREVGELVADPPTRRPNDGRISVYRSVGVAAQDAAAARLVLEAARARGLGTEVTL
jgi:ornithine cyclodeaminase